MLSSSSKGRDLVSEMHGDRQSLHTQVLATGTAAGRFLSAPVLAMFAGMAVAATGLVPSVSPAYNTVSSHVMPLAAALCLLEADLAECARCRCTGGPALPRSARSPCLLAPRSPAAHCRSGC